MKRRLKVGLALSLVFVLSILTSLSAVAATTASVNLLVNGNTVDFDVPPIIVSGRTLIPVRKVAEVLGATVDWDGDERKVTVQNGSTLAYLWIDSARAEINGFSVWMDVPATIMSDRTLVPLRFIAELLEFIVDWDDVTRTVHLTAPGAIAPTRLVVQSSLSQIRVGDTVTVNVRLVGARSAYTAVVNLAFTPGVQAQKITGGNVLEGLIFQDRIDNTNGRIDYAVSRVGQVRGFSGDGLLYSVTFKAMGAGTVEIMPTLDSMVVDSGLEALTVVRNGLWLTINPR